MTNKEAVNWLINISADIGKQQHQDLWHYEQALSEIKDMLEAEPERKIGKWIYSYSDRHCSVCNASFDDEIIYMCENEKLNFCPNCGADMRGEE